MIIFLMIFVISIPTGAFLELDDRNKMEDFIRNNEEFTLSLPECQSDQTMFDFYVNAQGMSLAPF